MGILLQVAFQSESFGSILARRDVEGNFLVREVSEAGEVSYRIVIAPKIPLDALKQKSAAVHCQSNTDYVQTSDDVFVDLSCFHPLMHITRLFIYSFFVRGSMEQVELMLSYPRGYGDKIDRELELHKSNITGMGQNWIAEDILFYGSDELAIYYVANVQVINRGNKLTEVKLTLHSRSKSSRRRLRKIMQSEDLNCTFVLNGARRDFFLGSNQENKKGHQI